MANKAKTKTVEIDVPLNLNIRDTGGVPGTLVEQPTVKYEDLGPMDKSAYDIAMKMGADPRSITLETLHDFVTRSLRHMASVPDVEVQSLSEEDLIEDVLSSDISELDRTDPKGNVIKYASDVRHNRMSQELSDTLSKLAEGIIRVERFIKKDPELN